MTDREAAILARLRLHGFKSEAAEYILSHHKRHRISDFDISAFEAWTDKQVQSYNALFVFATNRDAR